MTLTQSQKNLLFLLANRDTPNKEIAERLGLPLSDVYALRSRYGITRAKCGFANQKQAETAAADVQTAAESVPRMIPIEGTLVTIAGTQYRLGLIPVGDSLCVR